MVDRGRDLKYKYSNDTKVGVVGSIFTWDIDNSDRVENRESVF